MENTDVITQLMASVDTSTLMTTIIGFGGVILAAKFAEKAVTFVKRLIGKI